MNKFEVFNNTDSPLTILNQTIAVNSSYVVPDVDIVNWAKDAYFLVLLMIGDVLLQSYGQAMKAVQWCNLVASGQIVYS